MKEYVTESEFVNRFDRMDRGNQFTVEARRALFEHMEQLEDDLGEETEFDVIAICCDYAEYKSAVEACEDLGLEIDPELDDDEKEEAALELLRDHTQVVEFEGGVVVQNY